MISNTTLSLIAQKCASRCPCAAPTYQYKWRSCVTCDKVLALSLSTWLWDFIFFTCTHLQSSYLAGRITNIDDSSCTCVTPIKCFLERKCIPPTYWPSILLYIPPPCIKTSYGHEFVYECPRPTLAFRTVRLKATHSKAALSHAVLS